MGTDGAPDAIAALSDDDMTKLGAEVKSGTPQAFAEFIAEETRKWAAIIKSSGLKLD